MRDLLQHTEKVSIDRQRPCSRPMLREGAFASQFLPDESVIIIAD